MGARPVVAIASADELAPSLFRRKTVDWNLFNLATQGVAALKKLTVAVEEGKTELSAFLRGVADQIDSFDVPHPFGSEATGGTKKKYKKTDTPAEPVSETSVKALENDVAQLESQLTGQKSFGGVTVTTATPDHPAVQGPAMVILFQIGLAVLKALLANKPTT